MHGHEATQAFKLLSAAIDWEKRDEVDWDASPETLSFDDYSLSVIWSTTPKVGGPVRIAHNIYSLVRASVCDIAEAARSLVAIAIEVDLHSRERADFEQSMRATARSLLRRKAAAGIRLIDVVSETIFTDSYQSIGLEVTFEYDHPNGPQRISFGIGNEEDLKISIERIIEDYGLSRYRAAA